MLIKRVAKWPLNILFLTTLLALTANAALFALTIVYKYLGFSINANPISCSTTQAYFLTKFV
jgi:hypothetical protein